MNARTTGAVTAATLTAFLSVTASAQATDDPTYLKDFARCRAIGEVAARAGCYDKAWDAFEQARRTKRIVVLDDEAVKQTRRGLFGFGGLRLPVLGGDDQGPSRVESRITAASELAAGRWQFTLEDSAVWQTTEPLRAGSVPRRDLKVVLTRGAIGNYFARFGAGTIAIRAKRVR